VSLHSAYRIGESHYKHYFKTTLFSIYQYTRVYRIKAEQDCSKELLEAVRSMLDNAIVSVCYKNAVM